MKSTFQMFLRGLAACALIGVVASFAQAATIIKLNLGGVGPDIGMNAGGVLSTVDQTGGPPPTGDQFTAIEYTGFLNYIPDVNSNTASFSMFGLQAVGGPIQFGSLVIQNFVGGRFELYDPADNLLLSGPMANSALSGVTGPPGTGALFTTSLGNVDGGSLQGLLAPGSVSLSMNLTNVNGGNGFAVNFPPPQLAPFFADASINIAADPIPEPASFMLLGLGSAIALACGRSRRS